MRIFYIIVETMTTFEEIDRNKVYFTHLNHTNPAIHNSSSERLKITQNCCHVAEDGMIFNL